MWVITIQEAVKKGLVSAKAVKNFDEEKFYRSLRFDDFDTIDARFDYLKDPQWKLKYESIFDKSVPTLGCIDMMSWYTYYFVDLDLCSQLLNLAKETHKHVKLAHYISPNCWELGMGLSFDSDRGTWEWYLSTSYDKLSGKVLSLLHEVLVTNGDLTEEAFNTEKGLQEVNGRHPYLKKPEYIINERQLRLVCDYMMEEGGEYAPKSVEIGFADLERDLWEEGSIVGLSKEILEYCELVRANEFDLMRITCGHVALPHLAHKVITFQDICDEIDGKKVKPRKVKYSRRSLGDLSEDHDEGWIKGVTSYKGQEYLFLDHKHGIEEIDFPSEIEDDLADWSYAKDLRSYFNQLDKKK